MDSWNWVSRECLSEAISSHQPKSCYVRFIDRIDGGYAKSLESPHPAGILATGKPPKVVNNAYALFGFSDLNVIENEGSGRVVEPIVYLRF